MNNVRLFTLLCLLFVAFRVQSNDLLTEWQKMHQTKQKELEQFNDYKYGMFIHWGLYAIPAGIWKGVKMEEKNSPYVSEWIQYVFQIPRAEYANLADEFNPIKFDADSIVQLAKDAGMKFIVITAKHHDGFAMYHSDVSDFNIVDATPFKRDVIQELYESCKKNNIGFGVYYSHARDWADGYDSNYSVYKKMNDEKGLSTRIWGANIWDPSDNTYQDYLDDKATPQVQELLRKLPGLFTIWYDASTYMLYEQSFHFYKIVYDIQPSVLVNDRVGHDFGDYYSRGDNVIPEENINDSRPWQTVGTTNNSWGYKSYDKDYKSVKEQLWWLIKVVSRGGNYLLNVGPTAEGVVPGKSAEILRQVGKWVHQNARAIYNTKKWKVSKEGPTDLNYKGTTDRQLKKFNTRFTPADFWFSCRDNKVYAMALEYPGDYMAKIKSLKKNSSVQINSVKLLALEKPLEFQQSHDALIVQLPQKQLNENGYALEIELKR